MLQRNVEKSIEKYLLSNKNKALLVDGARQVGKTYIIRELLKKHNLDYVEINFIENKKAKEVFTNFENVEDIINRITAITNHKLIKNKTIIFFDEVQEVKEIVTSIKFLVEEGSFKYILSGSMLGVELNDIKSQPVGFMDEIKMNPLDFTEFITALGVQDETIKYLYECFLDNKQIDEVINEKILKYFSLYNVVGGMPEAVNIYKETFDLNEVLNVQRNIILRYREDIVKYVDKEKLYIKTIYDNIPSELNKENKRFKYTNVGKNFRFTREENNFLWLVDAGVANACYVVDELRIPLKLSKSTNLFKLYLSDVGLLTSMYDKSIQMKIINNDNDINYGAIYENAVSQILKSHGYDLYYYNNKKRGELDFVIENNDKVYIIEIKSGKTYNRHNALSNVVNENLNGITEGNVFANCNYKKIKNINYYPIYMIDFLRKEDLNDKNIYKVE